jgi:hypothetical protein
MPFPVGALTTTLIKIFLPVFDQLSMGYRELDEDQEMVSPAQVCAMFVDWTDPQKAMYESDPSLVRTA